MPPPSASRASPGGAIRPLSMQAFQWVSADAHFAAGIKIAHTLHCSRGAVRRVRSHIPGALSILKGAVPDRARGPGHMAPTYFRREPGIDAPTAIAAPRSFLHTRMPNSAAVDQVKARLRGEALARRDALPAEARAAAARAIAARPFPVAIAPGMIVSGFMPLKSEISPIPLMRKLVDAGARLALPVVAGRGRPLIMRA